MAILGYNYDPTKDLYWLLKSQKVLFKWVWSKEIEYISREDLVSKVIAHINYESYRPISFFQVANRYEKINEYLVTDVVLYKDTDGNIKAIINKFGKHIERSNRGAAHDRIESFYKKTYNLTEETLALFLSTYFLDGLLSREMVAFWESLTPLSTTTHDT